MTRQDVLPAGRRDAFLSTVRFHNRVLHLYDDVSADEIWRIIEVDFPDFDALISAIAARYFAA